MIALDKKHSFNGALLAKTIVYGTFALILSPLATQAELVTKANNSHNLNLGSSWIGGSAPGSDSIATWDRTVSGANSTNLGESVTWGGLRILDPGGTVSINIGTNTLNITGAGIDLSCGTGNLIISGEANRLVTNPIDDLTVHVAAGRQVEVRTRIEQSGRFVKSGEGALWLTGSGDNPGTQATVNGGELMLAKTSNADVHALGGGTHIVNSGSILRLSGTGGNQIFSGATVHLDGGILDMNGRDEGFSQLVGNGNVINSAAATNSTLTLAFEGVSGFSGGITGEAGSVVLNKAGSGKLSLFGTANNSGMQVIVSNGVLSLQKTSANALGGGTHIVNSGSTLQLAGTGDNQIAHSATVHLDGGILDMNGRDEGFNRLIGNGSATNSAPATNSTLTLGAGDGSANFSGTIGDGAGTMSLVKTGDGTLTLTSAHSYTGTTTIEAGSIILSNNGAINASPSIRIEEGAVFGISPRSGNRPLYSYSGNINGQGTIDGDLVIGDGGVVSPGMIGESLGALSIVSGTLAFNPGGTLRMELANPLVFGFSVPELLAFDGSSGFDTSGLTMNSATSHGDSSRVNDIIKGNIAFHSGSTLQIRGLTSEIDVSGLDEALAWKLIDGSITGDFSITSGNYTLSGGEAIVTQGGIHIDLPDLWGGEETGYHNWDLSLLESHGILLLIPDTTSRGTPHAYLARFGWTGDFEAHDMADVDGDGLAAWQEFQLGTNPTLWSTDGDQFSDGVEAATGGNPLRDDSAVYGPILANPEAYGFFTEDSVADLGMGRPWVVVEDGKARISLDLFTTDDLSDPDSWTLVTPEDAPLVWEIPVDAPTRFFRIQARPTP